MSHSELTAKLKDKDKLNLYMIGHSPDVKYLERLLGQISPILKTISFVNTDEKDDCLEVIKDSGVAYEYEKMIFPNREDFDFSKARNRALEMAKKNEGWFFWLDCDDTIENPEEILLKMEEHKGADAYGLPYNVNEKSGNLFKVRIHKGDWSWRNPVHEEIMAIGDDKKKTVTVISECPVKHAPDENKSNHDFHISLLKKSASSAESDYTYLAKEYFNSCRFEEAISWGKKAISIHSYPHEIYNLWMMVGLSYSFLEKAEEAKKSWISAIPVAPYRKEAYYYLAEIHGKEGGDANIKKGFGYITACTAQVDRKEPLQNNLIYTTTCFKLHARYLQKFNLYKDALEVLEKTIVRDEECETIKKELEDACS